MRNVIRRVSQKLKTQDLEDLVIVHEVDNPLLAADRTRRRLQKGKIPPEIRDTMATVPMNYRFTNPSSNPELNPRRFLIDIPQRGADPLRLSYASERRHCALATSAGRWGAVSTAVATLCSASSVILPDPFDVVSRYLAVVFALVALVAVAVLVICHRKSEGRTFQTEDYADNTAEESKEDVNNAEESKEGVNNAEESKEVDE
ncbi:hypothetical protein DVH05_000538 [Phytophthora capsici]|nr:hypothetical protein DVH05_000538 [Phytophthora capsici]